MQLKKLFAALAVSGGLVFTLAGCGDKAPAEKTAAPAQTAAVELKIGVSPVPHADIINFVAPTLEKEGVKVKVIEFNDYVQLRRRSSMPTSSSISPIWIRSLRNTN